MSSVGSSSVPPRHGKKLADAMEEAFKNNSNAIDEAEAEKPQGDARTEAPAAPSSSEPAAAESESAPASAKAPVARKIEGYTFQIASVYPPQPCDRCIRSKKTCRGIEGARCEHCKSLHQKCSNSTGPPRGRHAALRQDSTSLSVENSPGQSAEPARTKRKAAPAKSKADAADDEGEDEVDEPKKGPAAKKRRIAGDFQASALKDIADLEASIKKLQTSVTKDLAKLSQLTASLATQIRGMDN
ncbi:hypothetical protein LshimejAT787_0104420 [Lyophyllum shimeji]|uniref:Zn(2)-C6 fungal-type domain-containing protein n=1 Tax=Lyophyllum shimeji TaxID=47721 RepID=A0A9P3PDQ5_LYOSH|nr:hypothetical protein LshimejAT787_0104420 [Lyophyllum shimeji]